MTANNRYDLLNASPLDNSMHPYTAPVMDFGDVIKAMKSRGGHYRRRGWNGKGMYIYMVPGHEMDADAWPDDLTDKEASKGGVIVRPHIDMYDADGRRVVGWLASQTDMLADDWEECRWSSPRFCIS